MDSQQTAQLIKAVNANGVMMKEMKSQFSAVLESVSDMQQHLRRIPAIEQAVSILQSDVTVIKMAVKDMSHQITNHENRLTKLEHL